MRIFDFIERNDRKIVFVFIVIYLFVRLTYNAVMPSGLGPDARGYYTAAINLVEGNGYSEHNQPPYDPFYFREPGTSYLQASVMWLYKMVTGTEQLEHLTTLDVKEMPTAHQHVILCIQMLSSVLQLIAMFLFASMIRRYAGKKFSIMFLIISVVYFPLVIYTTFMLREVYLFFILALSAWFWERYARLKQKRWLLASSISCGTCCLFLQAYMYLLPVLLFILCFIENNWRCRFGRAVATIMVFFLPVMPWIYHVYQYYPDIRVAKSLGVTLTMPYLDMLEAYRVNGIDPYYAWKAELPGVTLHHEYILEDAATTFDHSFDGTYAKHAAELNAAATTAQHLKYKFDGALLGFRNTVFVVGITYGYAIFYGDFSLKEIAKFLFCSPYLLLGLLALCAFPFILKKYWKLLPIFLFQAGLFFVFGSEERRQTPLIPYIILFALCAIYYLFKKYKVNNQK